MSPEEIKEYERMGEENIRCMSRFALAHGYKLGPLPRLLPAE